MADINLIAAFLYGLSSSLTLCLASCLPVYLPILFGYGDDPKKGLWLAIGFGIGRFLGYFILGIVAAILGANFIFFFGNTFPKISMWIIFFFGIITILYGTMILAKLELKIFKKDFCRVYSKKTRFADHPTFAAGLLGFVSTITPCVPVFSFLLLPFALGKIWETSLITIAFGLGANIVFLVIALLVAFGVKNVKEKFKKIQRRLEILSAITLIIFGVFYLIWVLGPLFFGFDYNSSVLPTIIDFFDFVKFILRIS